MTSPDSKEPVIQSTDEPEMQPRVEPQRIALATSDLLDTAWKAMRGVYDPELNLDIVSLGLVYGVRYEDSALIVEMTMTAPGCPASELLTEMTRAAIADAVDGSVAVEVRVVWEPQWNPGMVSEDAARSLGLRTR